MNSVRERKAGAGAGDVGRTAAPRDRGLRTRVPRIALLFALLALPLIPLRAIGASSDDAWRDGFNLRGADGDVAAAIETPSGLVIGGGFRSVGHAVASHVALWDGASWHAMGDGLNGDVETFAMYDGNLIAGGSFTASGDRILIGIARWDGAEWVPLGAGTDGAVRTLTLFHGDLIAGGRFTEAGSRAVQGLARWDGSDWYSMDLQPPPNVSRIQVLRAEATNDSLFASCDGFDSDPHAIPSVDMVMWGGARWTYFNRAEQFSPEDFALSGHTVYGIGYRNPGGYGAALWTGANWIALGASFTGVFPLRIFAHEGSIYVATGSSFYAPAPDTLGTIVRMQEPSWLPIPGQPKGARAVLPLGTFGSSMIVAANRDSKPRTVASASLWDGASWRALDEAAGSGCDDAVHHLAPVGPNVYLSGDFRFAGAAPAGHGSAVWNGSAFQETPGFPRWSALVDFRGNPVVAGFAGTCNPGYTGVALLQDGRWTTLGEFNNRVNALTVWNDRVIAGGRFSGSCDQPLRYVAAMDGTRITALGSGPGFYVDGLTTYQGNLVALAWTFQEWNGETWRDLGNSDAIDNAVEHAGGLVTADYMRLPGTVRRWDGSTWRQLGGRFSGRVNRVAVYQGSLVVGGEFDSLAGRAIGNVARWNGVDWAPLGTGLDGAVEDLCAVGDDLYVAGRFRSAGGKLSSCFAMWSERVPVLSSFEAGARDTTIRLAWSGSVSPGYAGVRIRYSTGDFPTGPRDGLPVDNGNDGIFFTPPGDEDSLRIAVRPDGARIRYAAFAFDSLERVSPPLYAEVNVPDRVAPSLHLFIVPSGSGGSGVQVVLHTSEPLDSTTVGLSVGGRGNRMTRGEGIDWIWSWPTPEGDSIAVIATATDPSGNPAAVSRTMAARRIAASIGGTLSSADRKVRIDFPAGSLSVDRYVSITAERDPDAYQFLPRGNLQIPAVLTFRHVVPVSDSLAITNWERGGRERTFLDREEGTATASIPSLGCYQLMRLRPEAPARIEPGYFAGLPPAPNPFRTTTHIRFETRDVRPVRIRIMDVSGRDIVRPFDSFEGPGVQDVMWSGRDRIGHPVPAGMYFYAIESRGKLVTGRILKVR